MAQDHYEHMWWQFNIAFSKRKDCPPKWLELLFSYWVGMVWATEWRKLAPSTSPNDRFKGIGSDFEEIGDEFTLYVA